MSASDHVNSKQLKLFMTPEEIMSTVSDSVDRVDSYTDVDSETGQEITVPAETMDDVWRDKLSESRAKRSFAPESLYSSIEKHGVQRHVTLQEDVNSDGKYIMGQGHHRVAAAADIAKRTGRQFYIPVIYDDDWNYSNSLPYRRDYPHNVSPVGFNDQGY